MVKYNLKLFFFSIANKIPWQNFEKKNEGFRKLKTFLLFQILIFLHNYIYFIHICIRLNFGD